MQTILCSLTLLLLVSQTSFAANTCIDISGKYALPTNTETQKTTLIYSQSGCDQLIIAGTHVSTLGGVTLLPTVHFSLNGMPPKSCPPGTIMTCAAYSIADQEIQKVLVNSALADGGQHGVCEYTTSILSKDAKGNLLESVQNAYCEDGYKGKLQPLIFKKQN